MKKFIKFILSILAIPFSYIVLGTIYGFYKIETISATGVPITTSSPMDFFVTGIFILALFTVPIILIWLIWKKI